MRFIDNVGSEIHRLWSVRLSIYLFVLTGAVVGLGAFTDYLNPWWFLGLNMIGYGAIGLFRVLRQDAPSTDVGPQS